MGLLSKLLLWTRKSPHYWPVTMSLQRLGERLRWDWLIYNPLTFAYYHATAVESAAIVADALEDVFPSASRFSDIGAGTGGFAAELQRRGKTVVAYERSRFGLRLARGAGVDARFFDLTNPPEPETVDVAYSFEVAEHLTPELGDKLVDFCVSSAPVVVFSAALPGQGGIGHINEQPPAYWIARFEVRGLSQDERSTMRLRKGVADASASWLKDNVLVFR